MIESFVGLMQHMQESHPDSLWFGDIGWHDKEGRPHQFCQICGEELVAESQPDEWARKQKEE